MLCDVSITYSQSILDRSNSTLIKSNSTISSQKQVPLAGVVGTNNDENWGIVYRNIEENEIRDEKVEYPTQKPESLYLSIEISKIVLK